MRDLRRQETPADKKTDEEVLRKQENLSNINPNFGLGKNCFEAGLLKFKADIFFSSKLTFRWVNGVKGSDHYSLALYCDGTLAANFLSLSKCCHLYFGEFCHSNVTIQCLWEMNNSEWHYIYICAWIWDHQSNFSHSTQRMQVPAVIACQRTLK